MLSPDLAHREIDRRFFGLTGESSAPAFEVKPHLSRHDGKLYGGTAIAVSLAAIELATGRNAVWATTQLVSTTNVGSTIDCQVDVLAQGRRTVQARVTATCGDELIFTGVGAAAAFKEGGIHGCAERLPHVTPPADRPDDDLRANWDGPGWHSVVEMRPASLPTDDPSRTYLWMRFRDGEPLTPARLAFIADMVPLSVMRACGRTGAGTSLDNTLRVGPVVETDWVLLDLRPHFAHGGYGHGDAYLWSESGVLMATGSQSSTMLEFDRDPLFDGPPRLPGA